MLGSSAQADTILMKNGDRLSGEVLSKTKTSVNFKTSYAGTLLIQMDEVSELRFDEAEVLLKTDGATVDILGANFDQGQIRIEPADGSREYEMAAEEVEHIVPEPWRLGQGGKFTGEVNLALEFEDGNSESEELDLDYRMTYRRVDDRFRALGDLEMDSNNGVQSKQDWSTTLKYDRFMTDRLYGSMIASVRQEKYEGLDLRTTVGPALGYQFIEKEDENLLVELGVLWTDEQFNNSEDQSYWGPGWRLEYDNLLFEDRVKFYHRQTGTQSMSGEGDLFWQAQTGLGFPMWGGMVLSSEHEIEYDGGPAGGADKIDNTLRLKLGYQW
ncbi:MAG: DUF481 domain-containing protein [Akkermansiaceae bacterium]|nr:DUF481 domain-containing protein [Akkermansiaceae bacterium]